MCGHLCCIAQCEGQGTTSRNWFSFCIMWVVVIWHQVSLPVEPSFQLFKVLSICFPFDGCGTLPLNTVLDQVPHACWSILYHWPSCILQQCFCVLRKKKHFISIFYIWESMKKQNKSCCPLSFLPSHLTFLCVGFW